MEVVGLYIVEYHNDNSMKEKLYPSNWTVNSLNKRVVIFITYDESIFLANDD